MPPPLPAASPPFIATGGARIGWANATWPFARLSVEPHCLGLRVWLLGNYEFAPGDVIAIERMGAVPVIGDGIQIHHRRRDLPGKIIFWGLGRTASILQRIHQSGFLPAGGAADLNGRRGTPFRWSAILAAGAIWNALIFGDLARAIHSQAFPGPLTLAALGFASCSAFATLRSPQIQRLVIKPGRHVGEIAPVLRLQAFIAALMLIPMLLLWLAGGIAALDAASR